MEHVLGVQAGQPKVKKQERGLKAGGALGGTRFTGWQQIKGADGILYWVRLESQFSG
jgi:hypothetical protein